MNIKNKTLPKKPNVDDFDLQPYGYINALQNYIDSLEQALNIDGVIVPKGTVCGCADPDICQDNTGLIYCFKCKEPMTEQTAL